jgi:DNA-binding CsgD family transcriptional regulator
MIGKRKLQSFQDNFAEAFGISLCLLDLQGEPLCVWSNLPLFCDYMIKNHLERCLHERQKSILMMKKVKSVYIHHCFTGTVFLCCPIYYNRKLICAAYAGVTEEQYNQQNEHQNNNENILIGNTSYKRIWRLLSDIFSMVDYKGINTSENDECNVFHSMLTNKLSARELQIALLLLKNKSNRTIADEIYISEKTVKTHVSNILRKLSIKERRELIKMEDDSKKSGA